MILPPEAEQVLRDLNPWWADPKTVRPEPPPYRRPLIRELSLRLRRPKGPIEVVRGPRQVGKSTGITQIVQDLLRDGVPASDILLIRFDLEVLREKPVSLRNLLRWFVTYVRRRPLEQGAPAHLFLDEVHKLPRWHDEVKHLAETVPFRMLLTGSSSVLVARGGRESLAGRVFTTELPTFSFREVLECWSPHLAEMVPGALGMDQAFEGALLESAVAMGRLKPQQILSLRRQLERYYARGGYPKLHGGEVDDDRWSDYLVQTVFENVLGADIPDLFPVENPGLLRHLYLSIARQTAQEVSQNALANGANAAGFPTNQPTVRRYLAYLEDALLVRSFRRYPLAKKTSSRVPAKITLSDLGVRNAIFRGAPSLWESDPDQVSFLVETLVQRILRGPGMQVHFYKDFADPGNRRSPTHEVDFVVERIDGKTLPVEVKFRKRIDGEDLAALRHFMSKFDCPYGILVTRESFRWDPEARILSLPLLSALVAF